MSVLLMRFAAPMQSWGVSSRFGIRDTGNEPSKSGVIGLLCAALGKPRDEQAAQSDDFPALAALAAMRMGVRVLCEGVPANDYHTITDAKSNTILSTRHYLADADFLVGLESDDAGLVNRLDAALQNPHWQLFLGRKSFVPALPVRVGAFETVLETALYDDNLWLRYTLPIPCREKVMQTRLIIEPLDKTQATEVRQDVPLSFLPRRFTIRRVKTDFITLPKGENQDAASSAF